METHRIMSLHSAGSLQPLQLSQLADDAVISRFVTGAARAFLRCLALHRGGLLPRRPVGMRFDMRQLGVAGLKGRGRG